MNKTDTKHWYCESCGHMFITVRTGLAVNYKCPNCTREADLVNCKEYKKLEKQKSRI